MFREEILTKSSNRIVIVYNNSVTKIPRDGEAIHQNRAEAYIWEKTKHPYLCECKLKDGFFIEMEKIDEDLSEGRHHYIHPDVPPSFLELIKKHPNIEYGLKDGKFKIYDYADCEYDWSKENPEDLFIEDLNNCKV